MRNWLEKKGFYLLDICIFAIYGICLLAKTPCFFKANLGIICPGCGMRSALIAASNGDFLRAFQYHAMFWSLPFLAYYLLKDGNPTKNKIVNTVWITLILIGFVGNYIYQLTLFYA